MVGDRFGVSSRPKYSLGSDMCESGPFATDLLSGSRRTLSEVMTPSRNKPGDWKNERSALYEVVRVPRKAIRVDILMYL